MRKKRLVLMVLVNFMVVILPKLAYSAGVSATDTLRTQSAENTAVAARIESELATAETGSSAADIDSLVRQVTVLTEDQVVKKQLNAKIRRIAERQGIYPASIQDLYMAMGREEVKGFTVPAINIRGMTCDLARAEFRKAKKLNSGVFIFEIARTEIEYTKQSPFEYAAVILAAAIKEGWKGPVFIQADHFQVNAAKYKENPEKEIEALKALTKDAKEAGFFNVDIDASTLVDLNKPSLDEQQDLNALITARMTAFIRSIEHKGITISTGGEIGEVGQKNSTPEELRAFMRMYRKYLPIELAKLGLPTDLPGISKISVQTGTTHGGVVMPDGSTKEVEIDLETLRILSEIARKEYGMAGAVQHGASTLPEEAFGHFLEAGTAEVHLATGFQNMVYESNKLPADLKAKVYAWLKQNLAKKEWKEGDTEEQFIYKARKKGFGPFKLEFSNLSEEIRTGIANEVGEKFELIAKKLGNVNNREPVEKYVRTVSTMRVKRIGILTGGGPASGHNELIASALELADKYGIELVPIYEGWNGLIDEALVLRSLGHILTIDELKEARKDGGTILTTTRTNPYIEAEIVKKVKANIKRLKLDGGMTLGGDDTNGVTYKLSQEPELKDFLIIGLPKTMDNDLNLPQGAKTYGHSSFVEAATPAARNGIKDAQSTKMVLVVEVFGRDAGFVAAAIGARVGATRTLIPEEETDLKKLVEDVSAYYKQYGYAYIIVAEGMKIKEDYGENAAYLGAAFAKNKKAKLAFDEANNPKNRDDFGHPKLEDAGLIISAVLKDKLGDKKVKLVGKLDYNFRSAPPSALDAKMCNLLGKAAIDKLAKGETGQLLYYMDKTEGVESMELTGKELGGRTLDYLGADSEEYRKANLAALSKKELEGVLDTPALIKRIEEKDTAVFSNTVTPTYDNFLSALRELKETKVALVVGANVIFENAGAKATLAKIKQSQPNIIIAVWANNEVAVEKLKVMGVNKIADIISAKGLNSVLAELEQRGIAQVQTALVNSDKDNESIKAEYKVRNIGWFSANNPAYNLVNIGTSLAGEKTAMVNAMPLTFAKAIALTQPEKETVKNAYKELVDDYQAKNMITQVDRIMLDNLVHDLDDMPLVTATEQIAKDQIAYEETVAKV